MKLVSAAVALMAALLFVAGCEEGGETETAEPPPAKVDKPPAKVERPSKEVKRRPERPPGLKPMAITLDGLVNPANIGIVLAEERGYFEEAGLRVAVSSPVLPRRPATYLSEGIVDFAITHQPQLALTREKGAAIVAVRSLIPRPTASMIWLRKSKIGGIADLKGRTIGIPGLPFQRDFLETLLERSGLTTSDVEIKGTGHYLVPALIKGRVDAIFGGTSNLEGVELEARGLQPVVTPVQRLGIPGYEELVLATRQDRLEADPSSIRDFIAVVARGNAAALREPGAATRLILERNPGADRKAVEAAIDATLPLISPTGRMDPAQATRLVDWMHGEGQLRRELPASALLTNRYLEQP
jgi:putative hydroxymethylpyrimidine transport system substrate-binding protein